MCERGKGGSYALRGEIWLEVGVGDVTLAI